MNLFSSNPSPPRKFSRQILSPIDPNPTELDGESEIQQKAHHYRPVWIVLLFLIPCLALTAYYARYGITFATKPDSMLPNPSYAVVMFFVYLDSVGLVVLTLL
ncbi:MAG: hypothetical protein ACPGYT_14055, partial [Nitrospirales bacterium]